MIALLLLALFTPSPSAKAQSLKAWPQEVSVYFNHSVPDQFNSLGEQGYNGLFNAINDLQVFQVGGDNLNLRMGSKRDVYDNHDIFNSWTVVDTVTFDLNAKLSTPSLSLGPELPSVNFSLGSNGQLQYLDIRRSDPGHYHDLPTVESRQKEISDQIDELELPRPVTLDPERNAQYSKILRRVILPFIAPYTPNGLDRVADGEIISFNASGTVSVGGGIGWNITGLSPAPDIGAGAQFSWYWRDRFRYTILKESARFVRLKISHEKTPRAHRIAYGVRSNDLQVFQGFTITKDIKGVGAQDIHVTPFSFELDVEHQHIFDQCYRYDLTQEEAKHAYQLALEGNLKASADLAERTKSDPNPAVTFVFSRNENKIINAKERKIELTFLYRKQDNRSTEDVDADITLPDGVHHLMRSVSNNSKEWATAVGQYQKVRYQFSFFQNQEKFNEARYDASGRYIPDPKTDDSMSLQVEGFIDDYISSGNQMNRYADTLEALAGVHQQVFPRIPRNPPPRDPELCTKPGFFHHLACQLKKLSKVFPALYGRSSYYMKLGFDRPMLEKFIATPREEMWPRIEKAFGVETHDWENASGRTHYFFRNFYSRLINIPLYFSNAHQDDGPDLDIAKRFYKKWLEIQAESSSSVRLKKLGHLFETVYYEVELIKIMRDIQEDAPIHYTLVGSNRVFAGQIREDQWGNNVTDYLSQLEKQELDFEDPANLIVLDTQAHVDDLSLKVARADEDDVILNTRFKFSVKPKYVFYEILTDNEWAMTKTVGEVITANTTLQAGLNTETLDRADESGVGHDLMKKLKLGLGRKPRHYKLVMAISQDGAHWGPTQTVKFDL